MLGEGNLALNKPASLAKTYGGPITGRLAKYAVDGDTSTSNLERCANGDDRNNNNWLQIDLLDKHSIINITVYAPGEYVINRCNKQLVSNVRFIFSASSQPIKTDRFDVLCGSWRLVFV